MGAIIGLSVSSSSQSGISWEMVIYVSLVFDMRHVDNPIMLYIKLILILQQMVSKLQIVKFSAFSNVKFNASTSVVGLCHTI